MLLSADEVKISVHYTFERWNRLQNLEYKLGKEKTSITEYEKVTMISLALDGDGLFLLSTKPGSKYSKIISSIRAIIDKSLSGKKPTHKTQKTSKAKKQLPKKKSAPKTSKTKNKPSIRLTKKYTISELNSKLETIEKKIDRLINNF